MFGNKRRIAELEAEVARLRANLINESNANRTEETTIRNQRDYLVRTLRDIDDQIFKMSQCSSWTQMQPNFATLKDGMTARKVAESNRISNLIRPELINTYSQRQIGKK